MVDWIEVNNKKILRLDFEKNETVYQSRNDLHYAVGLLAVEPETESILVIVTGVAAKPILFWDVRDALRLINDKIKKIAVLGIHSWMGKVLFTHSKYWSRRFKKKIELEKFQKDEGAKAVKWLIS
jgi:hypothetical protein